MSEAKHTKETITIHHLTWREIEIEITFDSDWLNGKSRDPDYAFEHLQIRSIKPERAALPITETGYKSHFIPCGSVEAFGGPIACVQAWLDHEAQSPVWAELAAASKQMSLF